MRKEECERIHEELQKLSKDVRSFILWDLLGDYIRDYREWTKDQPDNVKQFAENELRVLGQQQFILSKEIW